jgi:hypothetical protein
MHVLPKIDTFSTQTMIVLLHSAPRTLAERGHGARRLPKCEHGFACGGNWWRKVLKVDQSANLRVNSLTSKIWHYGFEYRSLENGLRDKYWCCRQCKATKLFKVMIAIHLCIRPSVYALLTPCLYPRWRVRTDLQQCQKADYPGTQRS